MNGIIVCEWLSTLLFSLNMFLGLLHVLREIWFFIFNYCVQL